MCGIVGFCGKNPILSEEVLIEMRDTMQHRGPDSYGIWKTKDNTIILGHRRLAIIDLSPGGHQPMTDSTGRLTIVFNGEIYNFEDLRKILVSKGHIFHTRSDTEVILESYQLWGENCVKHFNGIFAFAIYDNQNDTLFAARDRAGEKPFYYSMNENGLIFGSELKALMKNPLLLRILDLESMDFYLAYGYVPFDRCIIKGVKKLPQGHSLLFHRKLNTIKINQYWSLPEFEQNLHFDKDDLLNEFKVLLTDSVRRQLVADVPVGILLSGGIDSSLITAIACQVSSNPVKTFTISFPGHGKFNEEPHARVVADHFGTNHTVLAAEAASVYLLPELARQYDEPIADSSLIPSFLVSRLVRQHVTVGIGGDGGDELFGGYPHYSWLSQQNLIRMITPNFFRSQISKFSEVFIPIGFRGRSYLIGFNGPLRNSFTSVNQFFDHRARRKIFVPLRLASNYMTTSPERFKSEIELKGNTILQMATALDFMTYLPDDLMVKMDRASMLSSLEMRAPFLDYRIIEFAFSKVPDSLKINGGKRKILLQNACKDLLPKSLDLTRKQGFSIPLAKWFEGDWGIFIKSILLDSGSWFDQKVVTSLIKGQESGLSNTQRLFALTMFELWRKEYKVEL